MRPVHGNSALFPIGSNLATPPEHIYLESPPAPSRITGVTRSSLDISLAKLEAAEMRKRQLLAEIKLERLARGRARRYPLDLHIVSRPAK
jgi:hypothetical protein